MIAHILFLPPAAEDVRQAMKWYDAQATGLGKAYLADLGHQLQRICQFPECYPRLNGACRRSHLQRFPHTIIYRAYPTHLEMIAVFAHRHDPMTARERTDAH